MALPEAQIAPPNRERYTLDGDASAEARIRSSQKALSVNDDTLEEMDGYESRSNGRGCVSAQGGDSHALLQ